MSNVSEKYLMNIHILDTEVQSFINQNRQSSPSKIALMKSPFESVTASEIASQIDAWQRAVKKLPTWAFTSNIYYPDKINIEQCSSEYTAIIKQTLIEKGAKVIDVTGGFGVDSCYIAQEASAVIHCELNERLSEIVKYNARQLGVHNLTALHTDGIEYVQNQEDDAVDYIYIDPSRRVNHAKVFLLEDCEPNIVELQDLFARKATYTIIKLSPLLDITTALQKLKHVKFVYVISVDGECKELLFIQERDFIGETIIKAVRLHKEQLQEIKFTVNQEKDAEQRTSLPLSYLYDPDAAITKAGAFKTISTIFTVEKLHTNVHLYTSENLKLDFPGRILHIINTFSFNQFKKQNQILKANVVSKNFPMKVEEIRKKFKIKDGGSDFLYFTTDLLGNHIVIHCVKI